MTKPSDQQLAANYMGAVAHLLGGAPGRHQEFIEKVELILSGNEPHALQLLQFTGSVRATGRPVIWIHHTEEAPQVPLIGLVAPAGDQVYTIENCMLWSTPNGRTTRLVPDNFKMGAFEFDADLRLNHLPTAPARSLQAGRTGIVRAYRRLLQLEQEQLARGDVFALPQLAKAA
ncbi:hypothetical protein GCM10011380_31370 [Sphingomonas metalli]|uniref:Uncharacterized protein n=1 Tax=Sphingomonas metalli TaxID=1779358 RepID=A0A916TEJ4_9SPHN|nr:hypothetical protein [Sphingomonas metalli]GGB39575.1 hypothetical protein GCM10011380_31370 [Sphingomonas metalli]